ncbi:MAG: hypothetical protein K6357_05360 [Elusimicrobiota bacterium]
MKLEVKRIEISSIVFSGFSVALFFIGLFVALVAIFITPSPIWFGESFKSKFIGMFIYTIVFYIITLAYISFLVFIYNFFVNIIGLKGLVVEMEEKQE